MAVAWRLDDGRSLCYRDDKQMGKVYLITKDRWEQIPGLADIGVDVLDREQFTLAAFIALAKKRRDQVRVFLMDKKTLDSFGNAYADEALWRAQLHTQDLCAQIGRSGARAPAPSHRRRARQRARHDLREQAGP